MNELDNQAKVDRPISFIISLGRGQDAKDLLANLDRYRKLCGWSRKTMFLIGMAMAISKNDDNPDLVLQIADFMEKRTR